MDVSCCAYGCNEKFVKGGAVTFHCFPKDATLRKVWELNVRRKNSFVTNSLVICSKHFEEDCFDRNKLGGAWLKKESVPTIFNFSSNHLSKKEVLKSAKGKTAVITELKSTAEKVKCSEDQYQPITVMTCNMNMTESSCVSSEDITWGEKEIATLIALYELEPCLYDRKDPNYSNIIERNIAYHRIKQVLFYILPTCTVHQIKNKIRNLCTQFITEKLSKECSIHNGLSTEDSYKPALWCYEHLQFLDDHLQVLPKKGKSKVMQDVKKESDNNNQCDFLAVSEANHQNDEDEISSEVVDKTDNLNRMSDEDDQGEISCDMDNENSFNNINDKDDQVETSSDTDKNSFNGMSDKTPSDTDKNSVNSMNDKDDQSETSSDTDKNSLNGMNDKDDQDETSSDMDKNSFNDMSDKDMCEESSDMDQNSLNGMGDKVNNKQKRKFDYLVSSSKKIRSEKMLDKEGIFGLYVADEMQNLRKNSSLYLKTKQSIFKILTNANFKLANVEL